jgi:hypothetical protein
LLLDSRVNVGTDGSIKENVPEGEDALGGSSAKQKKEQEKSENKSFGCYFLLHVVGGLIVFYLDD